MKTLILKNSQSPGDIVMLTAAVRDLHHCYPGRFVTDVRTPCPHLWENNPYITPLDENDPDVEIIECHCPLIHTSNTNCYHFIFGFIEFLNERLGLQIKPTLFKGDIHISRMEKSRLSQVAEITGRDTDYWLVAAGGKYDYAIKWWDTGRYQEVVDHFRSKIQFVQVGEDGHHHPAVDGVLDLRGKTDLRQLVRLVYHCQGILTPVSLLMHLAAAVETKPSMPKNRPCVVIAGGREPVQWEAYPHHQFIHTNGALRCCDNGGCWKSRTVPLGNGDEKDHPNSLCVDVVGNLPRCMDMITAEEVVRRIELYYTGGSLRYMDSKPMNHNRTGVARVQDAAEDESPHVIARKTSEEFIKTIRPYPGGYDGSGIVIPAGGASYFTNAWVCIKMLRHLGCGLPIQLWHLGRREMDERMRAIVGPLNVECVDAKIVKKAHPARILNGWEVKPYAIIHSPFKEVLLLDADNVCVTNPEFLFDASQYHETGAIFWPDWGRLGPDRQIWNICGVESRDVPGFESGQIVIDKQKCWEPLLLAMWYNEYSDFYYRHIHGDKETYHMAFRKLGRPYSMIPWPIKSLAGTMCQHDFNGNSIF